MGAAQVPPLQSSSPGLQALEPHRNLSAQSTEPAFPKSCLETEPERRTGKEETLASACPLTGGPPPTQEALPATRDPPERRRQRRQSSPLVPHRRGPALTAHRRRLTRPGAFLGPGTTAWGGRLLPMRNPPTQRLSTRAGVRSARKRRPPA